MRLKETAKRAADRLVDVEKELHDKRAECDTLRDELEKERNR